MFGLEAIFRNGVPVGHLRRSDYGFYIDKTIGYGYIRNPDGGVVRTQTHTNLSTSEPLWFWVNCPFNQSRGEKKTCLCSLELSTLFSAPAPRLIFPKLPLRLISPVRFWSQWPPSTRSVITLGPGKLWRDGDATVCVSSVNTHTVAPLPFSYPPPAPPSLFIR